MDAPEAPEGAEDAVADAVDEQLAAEAEAEAADPVADADPVATEEEELFASLQWFCTIYFLFLFILEALRIRMKGRGLRKLLGTCFGWQQLSNWLGASWGKRGKQIM